MWIQLDFENLSVIFTLGFFQIANSQFQLFVNRLIQNLFSFFCQLDPNRCYYFCHVIVSSWIYFFLYFFSLSLISVVSCVFVFFERTSVHVAFIYSVLLSFNLWHPNNVCLISFAKLQYENCSIVRPESCRYCRNFAVGIKPAWLSIHLERM